ncbi:MAG TPA: pyruvate, phosphate dikinase [Polyangiaceae bacterium]|nr:pyruvate, phosphate dikinase [Polyangiaceae bacterium]
MDRKLVYRFAPNRAEGRAEWRALLGGKGANLAEMANMGIPVPPGFTISTEACVDYLKDGELKPGLMPAVRASIAWLEELTGKGFGAATNPLLVSVRSGGQRSMPGMMDTILNLGLNDDTVAGLARNSSSERFAWDAYRRLLTMFGDVVLGIDRELFEHTLHEARRDLALKQGRVVPSDLEALARLIPDSVLEAEQLQGVVERQKLILKASERQFPADPYEQLEAAIEAVFKSWNNPRARLYRRMNDIPDDWGTAVNVQAMVFGNLGETSATGVAFTRDPSTGERAFFGEWLPNAQGEDVVAGIRTPRPLTRGTGAGGESLEESMPESYHELFEIQQKLEAHFRDMQDIEFTIEAGTLYLLQTRNGKRTARASVKIAVDMVHEGLLHQDEAILRVEPERLQELLFPAIDRKAAPKAIARGIPASPGAVSGRAVFNADDAERLAKDGQPVILIRAETSPEDLHGMKAAKGIVTARGGATSHAAVVARGMGRPCVAGCSQLTVEAARGRAHVLGADGRELATIEHASVVTIDGFSGELFLGEVPTMPASLSPETEELLGWTRQVQRMRVRANADTKAQAEQALAFGADGIGLCRTEHMFFDEERIFAVREMILAKDSEARARAVNKLLPYQTADFIELFRVMAGKPVNIRLLDPPLHEFLPRESAQIDALAAALGVSSLDLQRKIAELSEFNPMLGHRGVRLAISYPELPRMQVRAILSAACTVAKQGLSVKPEIMVPLVFDLGELNAMHTITEAVASEVFEEQGTRVEYKFGTMIELPRAALMAHELARRAEFFSFGTNDLTQTTLGVSRDDSGGFLPQYVEQHILPEDPFVSIDKSGVGELVRIAVEKARVTRTEISLGLCGEHGGEPRSIEFCEQIGLHYVSCSPFRIPIARVAAAQAAIRRTRRYWH